MKPRLLDLGRGGNVNTPVTLALGIIINRVETLDLVKHTIVTPKKEIHNKLLLHCFAFETTLSAHMPTQQRKIIMSH